jgi:hypothetical protein
MYRISRNFWLSIACGSLDPALIGSQPLFALVLRVTPRFPPHLAAFIPIGEFGALRSTVEASKISSDEHCEWPLPAGLNLGNSPV